MEILGILLRYIASMLILLIIDAFSETLGTLGTLGTVIDVIGYLMFLYLLLGSFVSLISEIAEGILKILLTFFIGGLILVIVIGTGGFNDAFPETLRNILMILGITGAFMVLASFIAIIVFVKDKIEDKLERKRSSSECGSGSEYGDPFADIHNDPQLQKEIEDSIQWHRLNDELDDVSRHMREEYGDDWAKDI